MSKRLIVIFLFACVLNFLWEEAHSVLYVHYKGQAITHTILFQAAIFDAVFTAIAFGLLPRLPFLKRRVWLSVFISVLFAIALELWALSTGRWDYTAVMPIVPIVNVGLTPTIQLALLGSLAYFFSKKFFGESGV